MWPIGLHIKLTVDQFILLNYLINYRLIINKLNLQVKINVYQCIITTRIVNILIKGLNTFWW